MRLSIVYVNLSDVHYDWQSGFYDKVKERQTEQDSFLLNCSVLSFSKAPLLLCLPFYQSILWTLLS